MRDNFQRIFYSRDPEDPFDSDESDKPLSEKEIVEGLKNLDTERIIKDLEEKYKFYDELDEDLEEHTRRVQGKTTYRLKVYALLQDTLPTEDINRVLYLIHHAFGRLGFIESDNSVALEAAEYHRQKKNIEKAILENPMVEVTIKNDDFYYPNHPKLPKGRSPEPRTKTFIKELYQVLSPVFYKSKKTPEGKLKKGTKYNALEMIQMIFEAFLGEYRTIDSLRMTVKRT